jgi:hypothetical protein
MSKQPIPEGLRRAIDQHHIAVNQFVNGDTRLWKDLCSKQDDVTIIGGWGGYERRWEEVGPRYDWAAAQFASSNSRLHSRRFGLSIHGGYRVQSCPSPRKQ